MPLGPVLDRAPRAGRAARPWRDGRRGMAEEQIPYLETFACAAELANFSAAAKALGLTQPAVSQRIQLLEQELGVPLFSRRGGRVLLTDAGRRLHGFAQRILAQHRQAREE